MLSIACPSTQACTAVGWITDSSASQLGLVEIFSAGVWSGIVASAPADISDATQGQLNAVSCDSSNSCSAVGGVETLSAFQPLVGSVVGGVWTPTDVSLPDSVVSGSLDWLACGTGGECTAAGTSMDGDFNSQGLTLALANGVWTSTTLPMPGDVGHSPGVWINGVACDGAGSCPVIGFYTDTADGTQGVIDTGTATPPTITAPPTVSVANSVLTTTSATSASTVTVSWAGSAGFAPVCSYNLQRSVGQGGWTAVTLPTATATSVADTLASASIAQYRVQAVGCDGASSGWTAGLPYGYRVFQENAAAVVYSPTTAWQRVGCASCSGGNEQTTAASGASATITVTAAYAVGVVLSTGPQDGIATVLVDGVSAGSVDTHAATPGTLAVRFVTGWGASYGPHTVQLVNAATAGEPQLEIDAVVSLYGATPSAPSAVSATAGSGLATVTWAAAPNVTPPVTSYTVMATDSTASANGSGLHGSRDCHHVHRDRVDQG